MGFSHRLSRAGPTFSDRPSGPRIHGDFAVSFLSQLAIGKLAALGMTKGRAALNSIAVNGALMGHLRMVKC